MFLDSLVERFDRIAVVDGYRTLSDDRAGIHTVVNDVNGAAGYLHAALHSIPHRMRTGKGGQQRRMGVDNPVFKCLDDRPAQDPHESSGDHEVGLVRLQMLDEVGVPPLAVFSHGDDEGGDSSSPSSGQRGGLWLVGADRDDEPANLTVEQCLEKSACPRCEHDDSRIRHSWSLVRAARRLVDHLSDNWIVIEPLVQIRGEQCRERQRDQRENSVDETAEQ